MALFINILLNVFDPLGIGRKFLLRPLWDIANVVLSQYKEKTKASFTSMQSMFLRFGILLLAVIVILWTAVFMYLTFYMTFMPVVSHIRPVHLQFK
jgi:seipin